MKATDLMIGDWVNGWDGRWHPVCVSTISSYPEHRPTIVACGGYGYSLVDQVKPIPITPEILEKNGFKEVDMNDFRLFRDKEYDCAGIRISFMIKGICLWKGDSIGISCKISGCCHYGIPAYVHLLQHALKLCGIEKEILI